MKTINKRWIMSSVLIFTSLSAFAAGTPAPSVRLNVTMRPQETQMWCWAASAQMVMEFLGKTVRQCDQANRRLGISSCCQNPYTNACVQGGWPEFHKYGFAFKKTSSAPLSWSQLQSELSTEKKPFDITWAWNDGGGHMMVANGYDTINNGRWVHILDPWPPLFGDSRTISYEEYVEGAKYSHWDDYYAVTPLQPGGPPTAPPAPSLPKSATLLRSQAVGFSEAVKASRSAAEKSIDTFRRSQTMSMTSALSLGEPFPVAWVGLNELNSPAPGSVVIPEVTEEVLYPIQMMDSIQGSVTVRRGTEGWRDTAHGNVTLTKMLVSRRAAYSAMHKKMLSDFYEVAIPALNSYFVAIGKGDDAILIPIIDDPSLEIRAGVAVSAKGLLPILRKAAQEHDGSPR